MSCVAVVRPGPVFLPSRTPSRSCRFKFRLALFHIVPSGLRAVTAVDNVFGSPGVLLVGDPPIPCREPGARV
jgi:hypothetical protein